MKIIKITGLALLGGALLLNASCKKTFYTDANVNTNSPTTVTPATLLSTVEGSLGYAIGGDMSRFACMFVQQGNGVARQSQAYTQYIFTGQDVDDEWGNMYTSVMENNTKLMQLSDSKGDNVYSGVSRVLMAYSIQMMVDNFGKMPFSQAFGGFAQLQPKYDDDKTLYATAMSLCDSAIIYMNATEPGYTVPGGEDLIYGGDATKWIKFAHAIKARLYMHQSKNNAAMANNALAEIALSFADNTDNAVYLFGAPSNANSPWFQFNNQRGDISFATSTLAYNLLANNDPRYGFMIDSVNDPYGAGLQAYYGGVGNSTTEFITYDELQFMAAEATLTAGGSISAVQAAYQNGISSSMMKLGVATADMATYLAANGTLTTANALQKIGYEVNVALFLNPEAWTTWRRTGQPVLTPTKAGANIPRRLLYPQTEYSYNKANTPVGSTLYTPAIFWDN